MANNSDDVYSDDNYDNNFDEDDGGEGDKKLAKIRLAMQKENDKAKMKAAQPRVERI